MEFEKLIVYRNCILVIITFFLLQKLTGPLHFQTAFLFIFCKCMQYIVTCSIIHRPDLGGIFYTSERVSLPLLPITFSYHVNKGHLCILIDYLLWVHRYRDLVFSELCLLLSLLQCVLKPNR